MRLGVVGVEFQRLKQQPFGFVLLPVVKIRVGEEDAQLRVVGIDGDLGVEIADLLFSPEVVRPLVLELGLTLAGQQGQQ